MTSTIISQPADTTPVDENAVALAKEQAASLRRLADLIQANPHLADDFSYTLGQLTVPLIGDDQKTLLAAYTRAATRAGAKVTKKAKDDSDYFEVHIQLGEIGIKVYANRAQVCERVVTGTREVTEEVPDPEALAAVPKTTVTRTEEIVEWVCGSILAPAAGGAA